MWRRCAENKGDPPRPATKERSKKQNKKYHYPCPGILLGPSFCVSKEWLHQHKTPTNFQKELCLLPLPPLLWTEKYRPATHDRFRTPRTTMASATFHFNTTILYWGFQVHETSMKPKVINMWCSMKRLMAFCIDFQTNLSQHFAENRHGRSPPWPHNRHRG